MTFEIPGTAIRNNEDQVALRYSRQATALVTCPGEGATEYVFTVKANIAMAYVEESDVECLLNVREGCCGGGKKNVISYIDETHHRRWTNGGGR